MDTLEDSGGGGESAQLLKKLESAVLGALECESSKRLVDVFDRVVNGRQNDIELLCERSKKASATAARRKKLVSAPTDRHLFSG
jgi:hypothetical protein